MPGLRNLGALGYKFYRGGSVPFTIVVQTLLTHSLPASCTFPVDIIMMVMFMFIYNHRRICAVAYRNFFQHRRGMTDPIRVEWYGNLPQKWFRWRRTIQPKVKTWVGKCTRDEGGIYRAASRGIPPPHSLAFPLVCWELVEALILRLFGNPPLDFSTNIARVGSFKRTF